MNDKELFHRIEEFEPNDITLESEPLLDDQTLQRIKAKTYAKLELKQECKAIIPHQSKRRHSWVLLAKVAAAIIIMTLIIPVSVTALTGIYKYVPGLGGIIETENEMYDILDERQLKTTLGMATLENVIYVNGGYANTKVNLQLTKINNSVKDNEHPPVLAKAALIINGERFETDLYSSGWGGDSINFSHCFENIPSLSLSDDVFYEFSLVDNTTYQFNVDLKLVDGEVTLSEVGPTDTKQDVTITAKVSEDNNILDVNFISLPNDNEIISDYCPSGYTELPCQITLIDSQGRTVQAERVFHHDRNNHFQFNVKDLVKPYVIKVNAVTMKVDTLKAGGIKQSIKLPKVSETFTEVAPLVVDEFTLPIKSIKVSAKQDSTFPLGLEQDENSGVTIIFDLNKEFINGKRIKQIMLQSHALNNPFSMLFQTFQGYGSTTDLDGFVEEMYIGLKRNPTKLNLYIWSYEVEVQGNWEFVVE